MYNDIFPEKNSLLYNKLSRTGPLAIANPYLCGHFLRFVQSQNMSLSIYEDRPAASNISPCLSRLCSYL